MKLRKKLAALGMAAILALTLLAAAGCTSNSNSLTGGYPATVGGVTINSNAEVIDTEGNVIPGLYAAGEVTGGIHGNNRLSGNAFSDIMTFGRIAGENAAAAE